jgi:hypothetical protein
MYEKAEIEEFSVDVEQCMCSTKTSGNEEV